MTPSKHRQCAHAMALFKHCQLRRGKPALAYMQEHSPQLLGGPLPKFSEVFQHLRMQGLSIYSGSFMACDASHVHHSVFWLVQKIDDIDNKNQQAATHYCTLAAVQCMLHVLHTYLGIGQFCPGCCLPCQAWQLFTPCRHIGHHQLVKLVLAAPFSSMELAHTLCMLMHGSLTEGSVAKVRQHAPLEHYCKG
jgi:hypothetical protein